MKIRTLWVEYEPDLMPNIMLAVDEYLLDENPEYWDRKKAEILDSLSPEQSARELVISIPMDAVLRLFELPEVRAEAQDVEEVR